MSMPWIQVERGFIGSPRHVRFADALGMNLHAALGVATWLWSWCREHAPDGVVPGPLCELMVEIGAGMSSAKPGMVVSALLAADLAERLPEGGIRIRGCDRYTDKTNADRQRKYRARAKSVTPTVTRALQKRVTPAVTRPLRNADVTDCVTSRNETENSQKSEQEALQHPLRNGDVTAGDRDRDVDRDKEDSKTTPLSTSSTGAMRVFEYWRSAAGHPQAKFDGKRKRAVANRLKDGYSVDELCQAVEGCLVTPHNMGENDRGEKYDDLELICRDAAHVDRFIANALSPPRATNPPSDVRHGVARAEEQTHKKTEFGF